jgi:hypothetical protein
LQSGLQLIICLLILWVIPLDIGYRLKRLAVGGLTLGGVEMRSFFSVPLTNALNHVYAVAIAAALIAAVAVGSTWIPATFVAFIAIGFYPIVVSIFPYSVVGVMGKEIQESAHGFNNNGLYIGVLTSFTAVSQLFVQIYGTERMAPLGTGNVMMLPCILFVAGILSTVVFTFTRSRN